MKILITGSNGLLGQEVVAKCIRDNIKFLATSKGANRNPDCPEDNYRELDITNKSQINEVFASFEPTHVCHTAAMTNVDLCENEPEVCERINTFGSKLLFEACKIHQAHFQLLSTDFVFDGEKGNYSENEKVNPLSVYAKSKVDAENYLLNDNDKDWSIVRTIIVYGNGHNLTRSNIIAWAKGALEKGDPLNIVNDQFRAPTYAPDLASSCVSIFSKKKNGIYHVSGPETLSIVDIVKRIGIHFNYDLSIINEISSNTLNQAAKRPPKTGFDLSKSYNELDYSPHTIEESLDVIFNQ